MVEKSLSRKVIYIGVYLKTPLLCIQVFKKNLIEILRKALSYLLEKKCVAFNVFSKQRVRFYQNKKGSHHTKGSNVGSIFCD